MSAARKNRSQRSLQSMCMPSACLLLHLVIIITPCGSTWLVSVYVLMLCLNSPMYIDWKMHYIYLELWFDSNQRFIIPNVSTALQQSLSVDYSKHKIQQVEGTRSTIKFIHKKIRECSAKIRIFTS